MDTRTHRRGSNTVTVRNEVLPPAHIPRMVLLFSLFVALVAIVTQFTRRPMPAFTIPYEPPTTNITNISDLIRAVFDSPQRGHFFRTECFSARSLLCHTLHDVSYVLDGVDVSDEGEAYVFKISKDDVRHMREEILLRKERLDGCTPWQRGSFFMKLDWLLLYYFPTSIASKLFGSSVTEAGYKRDRWGWCADTLPFGKRRANPSVPQNYKDPGHGFSPSYDPEDDLARAQHSNQRATETPQQTNPTLHQRNAYHVEPLNHQALAEQNMVYAR